MLFFIYIYKRDREGEITYSFVIGFDYLILVVMKASSDLEVLIGGNRKFDLFVVGLQEVPRRNMARLLQKVLVDTHRLERILLCSSFHFSFVLIFLFFIHFVVS